MLTLPRIRLQASSHNATMAGPAKPFAAKSLSDRVPSLARQPGSAASRAAKKQRLKPERDYAMKRLIFMTFLALAALTGSASAQTTLVIAIAADPTGFDPEAVLNNPSGFVMATIYDSLVKYKPGSVEVEPGLAESWEASPDGLTYTFHLRKGVKFHDG